MTLKSRVRDTKNVMTLRNTGLDFSLETCVLCQSKDVNGNFFHLPNELFGEKEKRKFLYMVLYKQ
jgi:hypothetical protein